MRESTRINAMSFTLIALTVICSLPFLFMLTIYVNWSQSTPAPVGADIGWGLVVLSSYPLIGSICLWLIYGLHEFMTSQSLPVGTYFSGLGRRLGIVLLVISCVFCAGWVRSFYMVDTFAAFGGRFESRNGVIERYATNQVTVGHIGGGVTTMYWSLPYVSILAPLVLTSSYLLLSKPRPPVAKVPA